MTKSAFLAAGAVILALAGCMTNEPAEPGMSAIYDCANGTRLKVKSLDADRIEVQMNDDAPLILPAVKAASGAKYMTPRHQFWDKGGEASWTVGRMMPMTCQKVTAERQ